MTTTYRIQIDPSAETFGLTHQQLHEGIREGFGLYAQYGNVAFEFVTSGGQVRVGTKELWAGGVTHYRGEQVGNHLWLHSGHIGAGRHSGKNGPRNLPLDYRAISSQSAARQIIAHEFGHYLGWRHSGSTSCIMHSDSSARDFCPSEQARIRARFGVPVTPTPTPEPDPVNQRPILAAIGEQALNMSETPNLLLTLSASDPENGALTFSVEYLGAGSDLERLAYQLDKEHKLNGEATQHENWGGAEEKWFTSVDVQWYFITPNGNFYHWQSEARPGMEFLSKSEFIAPLNSDYHATPIKLYDAAEAQPFGVYRIRDGNFLEIAPQVNFTGTITMMVTVTDTGGLSDSEIFHVIVTSDPDPDPDPVPDPVEWATDVRLVFRGQTFVRAEPISAASPHIAGNEGLRLIFGEGASNLDGRFTP